MPATAQHSERLGLLVDTVRTRLLELFDLTVSVLEQQVEENQVCSTAVCP